MQRRASSVLKAPEPSEGLRGLPGPAGPAGRGIGDAPGLLRAPGHEETMREAGLAPQVVPLRVRGRRSGSSGSQPSTATTAARTAPIGRTAAMPIPDE